MIKIYSKDGFLIVGTEGFYPLSLIEYTILNDRLTIFSPYVKKDGEDFKIIFEFPVSKIQDELGGSFDSSTLDTYLADQWTSKPIGTLSAEDRDSIISDTIAQVNANSENNNLGTRTTDPSDALDGQFWYNEGEEKMKIKLPTGIRDFDFEENLTTDAFGNPINIK